MQLDPDNIELTRLRSENARLIGLLNESGIAWHGVEPVRTPSASTPLSTNEKVTLFRRLFRGRTDVYPVRWKARQVKRATRLPAATSGESVSARSRESSALTAATGC